MFCPQNHDLSAFITIIVPCSVCLLKVLLTIKCHDLNLVTERAQLRVDTTSSKFFDRFGRRGCTI
jgi:hypothetical protein